jgi:tRNA pseudouridine55 synthase
LSSVLIGLRRFLVFAFLCVLCGNERYLTTEDTEEDRDNRNSKTYNVLVNGVLIIDKSAGMTSHDVVALVRKTVGERRVGHTGTLDPFATGVLVVLVGRATRLAQFLSGAEKEYAAVIRLGHATDTGDITGARVLSEPPAVAGGPQAKTQSAPSFRREEIEAALASLRGEIEQTPPMYSAKKIAGEKLYELARRGEEVKRKAVRVTVSHFEALPGDGSLLKTNDDGTSDLAVRVVCSAGTYVRTLAESVGEQLGLGAHLSELRRTRAGQFKIADAITLDRLNDVAQSGSVEQVLISPNEALRHLPGICLSEDDVSRTLHGIDLQIDRALALDWAEHQPVRLRDMNGELIAVGIYQPDAIHPSVVIGALGVES